jgi:hypothetical protein
MKTDAYVVMWWHPDMDGRPAGKPETSATTLNTSTVGLLINRPFGAGTDQMLELYADFATGRMVASIIENVPINDATVERKWEPYMDNKQWGSKRSQLPDDNGANDVDEA